VILAVYIIWVLAAVTWGFVAGMLWTRNRVREEQALITDPGSQTFSNQFG
jgi:hypothetical protein